ncbi:unnamed protein product, partial [Meganyctiphanes norvegica]
MQNHNIGEHKDATHGNFSKELGNNLGNEVIKIEDFPWWKDKTTDEYVHIEEEKHTKHDTVIKGKGKSKHSTKSKLYQCTLGENNGEKAYRCNQRGKASSQNGHLISHKSIHTGDKSYQCSLCEKNFTQNVSLLKHMRVHTGEKKYQCHQCGKSFSQTSGLISHTRIHTGEKPYGCNQCD